VDNPQKSRGARFVAQPIVIPDAIWPYGSIGVLGIISSVPIWNQIWRRLGLESRMSLHAQHVGQFVALGALTTLAAFGLRGQIVDWLQLPLYNAQLSADRAPATNVGFQSAVFGLLIAIVYLSAVYLLDTAPGQDARPKHVSIMAWAIPAVAFIASVTITYYALVPLVFGWLSTIDIDQIHTYITASSYRPFMTTLMVLWGAQAVALAAIPMAQRLGQDCHGFMHKWRITIEVAVCLGVLIFPLAPDPISKLILAIPFIAVYEITLWMSGRCRHRLSAPPSKPAQAKNVQRLPMAIAVPHRPTSATPVARMDQLRVRRPQVIDMRPDHKRFE